MNSFPFLFPGNIPIGTYGPIPQINYQFYMGAVPFNVGQSYQFSYQNYADYMKMHHQMNKSSNTIIKQNLPNCSTNGIIKSSKEPSKVYMESKSVTKKKRKMKKTKLNDSAPVC